MLRRRFLAVILFFVFVGLPTPPVARAQTPLLLQTVERQWNPEDAPLRAKVTRLPARTGDPANVRVYAVRFYSHDWKGGPVLLFGFYACPADASAAHRKPGVLLVHGGGGYATRDRTAQAAARGFAALAIDLPGKGTNREGLSRSSGPDMTVPNLFRATPDPRESYIYHAVRAQRRALTFLSRRPEADPRRLGLVGVSWGGATGLLTTATDARVRCFVDVFGAGYVREGSCWQNYFATLPDGALAAWERHFDARGYAPHVSVPVYAITATNDGCYWLPQFLKTTRALGSDTTLLLLPNRNHTIDEATHAAIWKWLAVGLRPTTPGGGAAITGGKMPGSLTVARNLVERVDERGHLARFLEVTLHGSSDARETERPRLAWSSARAAEGHAARVWHETIMAPAGKGLWRTLIPTSTELTYLFATAARRGSGLPASTPVYTVVRRHVPSRGPIALAAPLMTNRPATVLARAMQSHSEAEAGAYGE